MTWAILADPAEKVPGLGQRVVVTAPEDRPDLLPRIQSRWQAVGFLEGAVDADRELFVVLPLDEDDRLLGIYVAHVGGTMATMVEPAAVLRLLFAIGASKAIVAHNHPSGNLVPSDEDRESTQRLVDAMALFDMELVDHLIVGPGGEVHSNYSFSAQGDLR